MIAAYFERDQTPKGFHNLQLVLARLPYKISTDHSFQSWVKVHWHFRALFYIILLEMIWSFTWGFISTFYSFCFFFLFFILFLPSSTSQGSYFQFLPYFPHLQSDTHFFINIVKCIGTGIHKYINTASYIWFCCLCMYGFSTYQFLLNNKLQNSSPIELNYISFSRIISLLADIISLQLLNYQKECMRYSPILC